MSLDQNGTAIVKLKPHLVTLSFDILLKTYLICANREILKI
jgi:hypothetical protein